MIFFVLKAHGALHFGGRVDKSAQRIAGKGMVVAPGVDVFEFAGFVIAALGVRSVKEKTLDFVGGVERVTLFFEQAVGITLQDTANVGAIGRAVLVDHVTENKNFAGAERGGSSPVKRGPIQGQAKIALALRGETGNGGAVEGQIVPAFDEEFFVVVEHVEAAFEVAEKNGNGLDALFVGKIFETLFLDFVHRNAIFALLLGLQVHLLEFIVSEREKSSQNVRRHESS